MLAGLGDAQALDAFYLLVCGVFVFFMQECHTPPHDHCADAHRPA